MAKAVGRRYLTVRESCQLTGLSRWTIMRANVRGELPVSRIGSAVRVCIDDLEVFMKERAK